MNYEWKGNIRELQNVIERAIIFTDGDQIKVSDVGLMGSAAMKVDESERNLSTVIKNYEREYILRVLSKHKDNKAEAAKSLGIGLSSLYRKIDELGIKD